MSKLNDEFDLDYVFADDADEVEQNDDPLTCDFCGWGMDEDGCINSNCPMNPENEAYR